MDDKDKAFELIRNHYKKEHAGNKARVKYGIFVLWLVPITFLILMFLVDSSKIVFLVLWIVSLFIISVYLISVEYKDYMMWKDLKDVLDIDDDEAHLVDRPKIVSIAKEVTHNILSERNNDHEDDI